MKDEAIIKDFYQLSYDCKHTGLGWYIRKFGTCRVEYIGNETEVLERLNELKNN